MPDESSSQPLVNMNIGELSKPADTFVKKVFKVIGEMYLPWQIKRVAQAETEAAIIKAKGEIEVNDLQRRALIRFVQEQASQQENMESIMGQAVPEIADTADPAKVDDDWIANFFAKGRLVSNKEMQLLWAKLLATEANNPALFSKRTVNLLADMDKKDADAFTLLCSFSIYSISSPVIFYKSSQAGIAYNPKIYLDNGLDYGTLRHLETIGLITFDSKGEFAKPNIHGDFGPVTYFDESFVIKAPEQLNVGNVLFTDSG